MTLMGWMLIAALAVLGMWIAAASGPAFNLVRIRNALLFRRGKLEDFDWAPDCVPTGFRVESRSAPKSIANAVSQSGVGGVTDEWQRALAIAGILLCNAKDDGPVQADLETTFSGIMAGRGYCSDYVRVFIAAATEAKLFCRQWAFSFDGFGGHGHTVVEVYDRARKRWAFLDVYNNVYATQRGEHEPLSVLELRRHITGDIEAVEFRRAAEGRLGIPDLRKLKDYYRRGAGEWYLWFGNDVVTRDRTGPARLLRHVSGRLSHRLGSALGWLPPLVAIANADNEADIVRMEALRRNIHIVAALGFAFAIVVALFSWTRKNG